jgi:hypothetical protein
LPHIIYKGTADLPAVQSQFNPVTRNENGWIVKMVHCYMSEDRNLLLFETLSVRSGFSQNYYTRAEQKGPQVTIRMDPHTNVEKNEGVKRSLLAVRDLVLAASPDLEFCKSNLGPELLSPQPNP